MYPQILRKTPEKGRMSYKPPQFPPRAFTLIELLLVISIIGIMTAVTLPRFSTAMSGGRLSVATRLLARTGRYARTMALLHQAPVELVVEFDPPRLRVEPARAAAPPRNEMPGEELPEPDDPLPGPDPLSMGSENFGGSMERTDPGEEFSRAITVEHPLEKVAISFLGYEDSAETFFDDPEAGEARILYRSNGTCRPHRWRLVDERGISRELSVDIVGTFEVDDPDGMAPL